MHRIHNEVKLLGYIISEHGLKLDPDKISVIQRLKTPQSKKELQRIIGFSNNLSKFIKNYSELTEPLRVLLKKDVEWFWSDDQQKAMENIKQVLSSPPVLKFYDVNGDVKLSVDASAKSLGAVLLQEDQPIAYAAKALSGRQLNYSQIEKEALGIQFACKKFHSYIYGKNLTIETDYGPLESIFKNPIHEAPPRLRRILLEVFQYEPKIDYTKGMELQIADTLSRDCKIDEEDFEKECDVPIILPLPKSAYEDLIKETESDDVLMCLKKVVLEGWPNKINEVPISIRSYFCFREEISVMDGLLFKNKRIIIPKKQKNTMMKAIHMGHLDIQSCLKRARELLYWPNMIQDIADFVSSCKICQSSRRNQSKEPVLQHQILDRPWQVLVSDLFYFKNNTYILVVDTYSGFFEFEKLNNTTSMEVILFTKKLFATHGIPDVFYSGNSAQYTSQAFKEFAEEWSFELKTSSPYHSRSNGIAEHYVDKAKNILIKCAKDNTDVYLALLNYRNTPRTTELESPNQSLMSRRTKSLIPMHKNLLRPEVTQNVKNLNQKERSK